MSHLELQVSNASGTSDIVVSLGDETTVADVFAALALPTDTTIDGEPVASPATTPAVDALHVGASLSVIRVRPPNGALAPGFVDIGVVAGFDAGASVRLGPGLFHLSSNRIGHQDGWLLQVDPRDPTLGSPKPWQLHGPHIETIERRGDSIVAVGPPIDPEPAPSTTLHRPPRGPSGSMTPPIEIGDLPQAVREPSPLSWATLLAPIPVALLMAFFFRPLFALFAAMGPIMAVGRWWESRRRYRRDTASRAVALADIRREVQQQLIVQAEAEAQRRWVDNPHIAILWQRANEHSVRLWERRPDSDGFLQAIIGVGPERCAALYTEAQQADELQDLVDTPHELRSVPHTVDLAASAGLGVCGARDQVLAVARSLVLQLATLQGPADLRIGVLCSPDAVADWDWLKWLPHLDQTLVGHNASALIDGLVNVPSDDDTGEVVRLVVVDAAEADVARIIRTSTQAGGQVRVLAVGAEPTELPAVCATTAVVDATQVALSAPHASAVGPPPMPTGVSAATAQTWARHLAGVEDPELLTVSGRCSAEVSLLQLIGRTAISEIGARWSSRDAAEAPVVTLGLGADGPFRLDLTNDGPHALVAGTTGSGKSELLRSLVVGLAVECSPEHVNFVLVDFKGGGAFDVVRDLPHVVGVITDLDEALVVRALVSLRAELERRERLFRDLGVSAYEDAVAVADCQIARLVIVIDEFAVLATDYSELMTAIVDLAARGRSLGMHLVLATQRPSGVVDQKIRANTNLRIALRVQDAFDSQDVVGVPDAAAIDRKAPGQSIVRIGGDRAIQVQMAFSGALERQDQQCSVQPHLLFDISTALAEELHEGLSTSDVPGARTELQMVVDAIVDATAPGESSPRALWAPPLPASLDWIDLGTRELATATVTPGFALGLADVPELQRQQPWRWDPATGSLGIYGASGTCAGKLLVSLGAAMASAKQPDELHMYVIDGDAGATAVLGGAPHTGAYIRMNEVDRVDRALRLFEDALDVRRSAPNSDDPQLVLVIDNVAAVLAAHDEMQAPMVTDRLAAIARDGAPLGVHLVLSARTPRDISHRLAQQIPNRLVLGLADPSGYLALGIKLRDVVPLPSMRAIDVPTRHVVQLVEPPDITSWSSDNARTARSAPPIRSFPSSFSIDQLDPVVSADDGTLRIPVGVDSVDLGQAELVLRPGEHALVVGAAGMGRSTTAAVIADKLAEKGVRIMRVAPHRSPLTSGTSGGEPMVDSEAVDALASSIEHTVIVVDDADSLQADMATALEDLINARNQWVHIVAATTPDAARSVRSWTAKIRSGGTGILIGGARSDGEIFKVRLGPLTGRGSLPGRGNLIVRGHTLDVQLAGLNTAS